MWQTIKDICREFRTATPLMVLVGFIGLMLFGSFAMLGLKLVWFILRTMVSVAQGI